ncbi:DUF2971 domain-containing protein [Nocardioides stalactiti]|uniref:DUF2971 domain-containing protein n=1 Tax=Nocardioides stalactiti TaxID=2755356 RepID=UPI0015FEBBD0|nr:DUF2971 domain-containing protein [Nocardioides stalactiti]
MPSSTPAGVRVATEPVFHYTDAGALIGLVQGRVLWASEAAGMNDRAEVRQGWQKIRSWLEDQPVGDALDLLRHHANDPLKRSHEVFVLCASTRADDANQWRLYANRGSGYAVELDPSVPLIVASEHNLTPIAGGKISFSAAGDLVEVGPWMHVIYTEADIEAALQALVDKIDSATTSIRSSTADPDEKDEALQDVAEWAYSDLAEIAHLIKEPGFSGESEVRIVVTFFMQQKHIKYRAGAYGIVGYAELVTDPSGGGAHRVLPKKDAVDALPIKSVRLGPLLHEEHLESVETFLRNNGLRGVGVSRSEVPLR